MRQQDHDGGNPRPVQPDIGHGQGRDAASQDDQRALALARRRHGGAIVSDAIRVEDDDVWLFQAWFRGVERRSIADCKAGGLFGRDAGGRSDGIPMTEAMRTEADVPQLLQEIMDNPLAFSEAYDRGKLR